MSPKPSDNPNQYRHVEPIDEFAARLRKKQDFRGPIGRVIHLTPEIQDGGVLLAMQVQYGPDDESNPPSVEAVLLPLDIASKLSEELGESVIQWRETYIRR